MEAVAACDELGVDARRFALVLKANPGRGRLSVVQRTLRTLKNSWPLAASRAATKCLITSCWA